MSDKNDCNLEMAKHIKNTRNPKLVKLLPIRHLSGHGIDFFFEGLFEVKWFQCHPCRTSGQEKEMVFNW